MRPLTAFAQLAQQFESRVVVMKNGRSVDGKSPFEMFSMVSPRGAELVVEVSGPDAQSALEALAGMLNTIATEEDSESAAGSAGAESPRPDDPARPENT